MRVPLAEFVELAGRYPVVPVWQDLPADPPPAAVDVFAALGQADGSTLLENLETGRPGERCAVIGLDPVTTLLARDGQVSWTDGPICPVPAGGSLLETLRAVLDRLTAPALPDAPPLAAGAIGILGGDAVPDGALTFPRTLIVVDPGQRRLRLVAPVRVDPDRPAAQQHEQARSRLDALASRLAAVEPSGPVLAGRAPDRVPFEAELPDPAYRELIEAALARVRAGELRQVTVSRRFTAPAPPDPVTVYRALQATNPSPYPYLLRLPGVTLVGASPQGLVRVRGSEIGTSVIAGTRPRGAEPAADAALAAELLADAKERDEHAMLVELAQADLAGVARPGTVRVASRERLVRYARVMHLVTELTGSLAPGRVGLDALGAVFPAGTVAGMPRAAALRVIEQLEPRRRGLYGGAVGYLDFSGNLDLCLGIRTLQLRDGVAYAQAGAGVVAGSVPEAEVAESRAKASALFAALAVAQRQPV